MFGATSVIGFIAAATALFFLHTEDDALSDSEVIVTMFDKTNRVEKLKRNYAELINKLQKASANNKTSLFLARNNFL